MSCLGGIIDGAPENVQDAAIYLYTSTDAESFIHSLRVSPAKIAYPTDTYLSEVPSEVRSNSWDAL